MSHVFDISEPVGISTQEMLYNGVKLMVEGVLMNKPITDKDREKAEICAKKCSVCTSARKEQKGFKLFLVKIEEVMCPYCRAYKKVYGRKAHEPLVKSSAST